MFEAAAPVRASKPVPGSAAGVSVCGCCSNGLVCVPYLYKNIRIFEYYVQKKVDASSFGEIGAHVG